MYLKQQTQQSCCLGLHFRWPMPGAPKSRKPAWVLPLSCITQEKWYSWVCQYRVPQAWPLRQSGKHRQASRDTMWGFWGWKCNWDIGTTEFCLVRTVVFKQVFLVIRAVPATNSDFYPGEISLDFTRTSAYLTCKHLQMFAFRNWCVADTISDLSLTLTNCGFI